jgi:uncharacterized protein (TIGR03118 family)
MKKVRRLSVRLQPGAICLSLAACVALATGCHKVAINNQDLRNFQEVNLVANKASYNPGLVDPTLQNAWGLAWAPSGIAWVNSEAAGVSELYTADGAIVRPPVNVPSPTDTIGGAPIGIVFNSTKGFVLPDKAAASFIFAGGDGVISAWNGAAGNNAFRVANNSATAAYTGLALAASGGANFLYAADFRTGKIDVWDTAWKPVTWMPFHDAAIPSGFAPFNIQAAGSWLLVTYAKVGANGREAVGTGLGFVDIFNTDGSFVRRLGSRGSLNAPWGVTMAAANFLQQEDMDNKEGNDQGNGGGSGNGGSGGGSNSGHDFNDNQPVILVGNFGDGRINVFSLDGQFLGQLQSHKQTIVISGLWALGFAPATATTVDPNRLYFTAGPAMETDGVFGYLIKN